MATYKELKQKYIDHLMGMDLEKLDASGLLSYGYNVKNLWDMERQTYAETLALAMSSCMPVCAEKDGKESEACEIG